MCPVRLTGRVAPSAVILAYGMEAATIILMVVEVVIVAAGVFCRYILSRPIAGSDEIATLVLVWLTFLGGAVAQRRRAHPRVGLFVQHLSPSARAYVDATARLIEVIFFACVCWYSLELFRLRLGESSAGAGFDMSLYPLALIIGVTATGLFTVGQLAALPARALLVVLGGAAGLGATAALVMYITGFQPIECPCHGGVARGFPGAAGVERPVGGGAGVSRARVPSTPRRSAPPDAAPAAHRRG